MNSKTLKENIELRFHEETMELTINISAQAHLLVDNMPNFNKADFALWWWNQQRQVGSNNILEYLSYKKRLVETERLMKEQAEKQTKK